ncbi:hypothetical protein [Nonomuraea wenchangensis]|uniref:hypothetical protein n=1 Tax=Nonomuraea wenchangensis TaxID=568860 RepID=UPI0033D4ECB4
MRSGCLIAVACAVLVPFAGLYLLFAVPSWANDRKLADLEDRLLAYPPPPETSHTDYGAEGSISLLGNGNHCDYRARISLYTSLSEEAVLRYYAAARIPGVEAERVPLRIYFERHQGGDGFSGSFIVEAFDSTDPGLDLRCH